MRNKSYLVLSLLLLFSSCAQNVKENSIVGTWKLIEFSNLDSVTNQWEHPFGKNPKGYFTYTSNNIVHLNISNEHPLILSKDSLNTTQFVYSDVMDNAVGYFGAYEVSLQDSVVIHKVEGGSIPFYIGTNQPRPFILKNDTLTIGDITTWKRVLVKID